MSPGLGIAIGLALLIGNAFFVASEFAVLSARRSAIEPLAEAGDKRAVTVLWAMEHVSLMLACAQLGVTVCSTGLGIVAEPALAHLVEAPLRAVGAPEGLTHPVAFVLALGVVVYLHVVLGEMVPKNVTVSNPDRAVLWFTPPLVLLGRVVRPVVVALNWTANHVVRLGGVTPRDEVTSAFTAQEVQSIVEQSQAEGVLQDEQGLLVGALEFSDLTAAEVMVPLAELQTLPMGCTPADLESAVAHTGFSRFPVLEGSGELVGYLHLKDVLEFEDRHRNRPIAPSWIRPMPTVSIDDRLRAILARMQRTGAHLARVRARGETLGVVFLEDILEELVGEVRDSMQRDQR